METKIQEIETLSLLLSKVQSAGESSKPFILVPEGACVRELEELLPRPSDKRGKTALGDRESFTRYVNEHKKPATRISRWVGNGGFGAIIDFHEPGAEGKASWCRHAATFQLRTTPQWDLWISKSGKPFSQREFAEFLEENYYDITEPKGAEILDVATTLQALTKVTFKSGVRLNDSTSQLQYQEDVEAKAGVKGDLDIPRMFIVTIPIFYGESAIGIQARLKYCLKDGGVSFRYELVRPQQAVDLAVNQISAEIEKATNLKPFVGQFA